MAEKDKTSIGRMVNEALEFFFRKQDEKLQEFERECIERGERSNKEVFDGFGSLLEKDEAAELMARMAEDVKDASLKVEDIVDRYVKTATPELRQQLIDKLTEIRKEKFGIE